MARKTFTTKRDSLVWLNNIPDDEAVKLVNVAWTHYTMQVRFEEPRTAIHWMSHLPEDRVVEYCNLMHRFAPILFRDTKKDHIVPENENTSEDSKKKEN